MSQRLKSLLNSSQKKWAVFICLFSALLAIRDYQVATLKIPPFEQLNMAEGMVRIETKAASRFGGSGYPYDLTLQVDEKWPPIRFKCRVHESVRSGCISVNDNRFISRAPSDGRKIKRIRSGNGKHAKAWWYETRNLMFTEKRLMQFEMNQELIFGYEEQKAKYLEQKSEHKYFFTILLILSLGWFYLLQLANPYGESKTEFDTE